MRCCERISYISPVISTVLLTRMRESVNNIETHKKLIKDVLKAGIDPAGKSMFSYFAANPDF